MGLFRRRREPQVVIDLREAAAPPETTLWGSPVPCPVCEGRGYLDHIDPYKEVMYLHCTVCGERYEVARAEVDRIGA